MATEHPGRPISYLVLREGTPVVAADGEPVGELRRVLAATDKDVFDGIVIDTAAGERFVEAPCVGDLYERRAELTLTARQVLDLPPPAAQPATVDLAREPAPDPGDRGRPGLGDRLRRLLRR